MAQATATAMDALEIDAFLADQLTGVLSMATEDGLYSIPVSFAYAGDGPSIFFRFGYGPNSQKRAFVEAAEEAVLVVYDRTDTGWKSVIAEGRLEAVSESAADATVVQAVNRLQIPFFQVHRQSARDLEFSIVRLHPDKLSGVAEAHRSA